MSDYNFFRNLPWKRFFLWLLPSLIIFIAISIRWHINFSGALIPGVNGPYYLVQVRSLLENGHLGFPDFPFIFWLEALIAHLLFSLNVGNLSECIMIATKGVDSIFPVLATIPVYLLAKNWDLKNPIKTFPVITVVAFSVINFPALIMISDFQKNAAGVVWLLFFLYSLYRIFQYGTWKTYFWTGIFFLLTGITHIGVFAIAISFSIIVFFAKLLFEPEHRRIILRVGALLLLLLIINIGTLCLFDPTRVKRLLSLFVLPLRIFERPLLTAILNGQSSLALHDFFNLIIIISLVIFGIAMLFKRWKTIEQTHRHIVIAAAISGLFLTSPLIGQEWASRFYNIAYVPTIFLLIFLFDQLHTRFTNNIFVAIMLSVVIGSALFMLKLERPASISKNAYAELYKIRDTISQPDETLVVARHGLEWWVAWVLRTKVGQEFALNNEDWEKYSDVFYITQIAGAVGFGHKGPRSTSFPEVNVPSDASLIFKGNYFRLYNVITPPENLPGTNSPPDASGLIVQINKDYLKIRTENGIIPIKLTNETKIKLGGHNLTPGANIQVWGKKKPFSHTITATIILNVPQRRIFQNDGLPENPKRGKHSRKFPDKAKPNIKYEKNRR